VKAVSGHRYLYRRGNQLVFRRGVPLSARDAFGGRAEVHVSLRTSNVAEARYAVAREMARFEKTLATLLGKPSPEEVAVAKFRPSGEVIDEVVRAEFRERIARVVDFDRSDPAQREAAIQRLNDLKRLQDDAKTSRSVRSDGPTLMVRWMAEALCEKHKWNIVEGTELWLFLLRVVTALQVEAAERQIQDLEGQPSRAVDETFPLERFAQDEQRRTANQSSQPVSLQGMFDGYVAERKPAPATVKAFGRQFRSFTKFLGHDDARRLSKQDVVRWKEALLAGEGPSGRPLSAKTVSETYLAVIRTVLHWGINNGRIENNVALGIRVVGQRKPRLRDRSLTDDEARVILLATFQPPPPRLIPTRVLARRWVPWLCAYTGARVNEMTQLRAEDIQREQGVWTIRITPEAGTTKDQNARTVALHPHLIEQGFVEMARGKKGPLFYDPTLRRSGSDENPQFKKVGEHLAKWVRGLGVSDPNVSPNHGWRHRFKSQARLYRMDPEVRDYIQGHAHRTEGEAYGGTGPRVTFREIRRLRAYAVPGS